VEKMTTDEMEVRDASGSLSVYTQRLKPWQISPIFTGCYIMCIGVMKERVRHEGVAMVPHVVKDLSDEREVREAMWRWELDDVQRVDAERERDWQTSHK